MLMYQALFEPATEGGYAVRFPDFGYGATQGETEAEAADMAADLLVCLLSDCIREGKDFPEPRKHRGRNFREIAPPALAAAKAEFYRAFLRSGIRKAELARRLGISKSNVDRLFDFGHSTRLDQMDAAFRAIGKRLSLEVYEAA